MNVLFLTQTYPRFDGDTSGPFIRDIARGLVRRGHSVTVLTPHMKGVAAEWGDDGVAVRSFRYAPESLEVLGYSRSLDSDERIRLLAAAVAPLYALGGRRALRRELKRRRYDLVHAHWVVPNALVAKSVSKRVPMAVGLHGSDVFLAEKSPVRWMVRRALARAVLLTGCSPELVDRICAVGFPKAESAVIPYGVDSRAFSPDRSDRSDRNRGRIWREKLSIPPEAQVILTVGRMVTKKGYQVLMPLLKRLLTTHPDAHLVMAGSGDRLEEFRQVARAWPDRVHLPGAVYRDTLPDLYRAADLFVLPAVHDPSGNVDGLPNVILEAMASGLPVVATEISGIPLAIGHEKEGLLVPEGDGEALYQALDRLLKDEGLRRRMGQAGRSRAERKLSWDEVAGQYQQAYERALERAPAMV